MGGWQGDACSCERRRVKESKEGYNCKDVKEGEDDGQCIPIQLTMTMMLCHHHKGGRVLRRCVWSPPPLTSPPFMPSHPSLVEGGAHPPLLEETIGEYFDKQVEQYGDKLALVVIHQVCPSPLPPLPSSPLLLIQYKKDSSKMKSKEEKR